MNDKQSKQQYKTKEETVDILDKITQKLKSMNEALENTEKAKNESSSMLSETKGRIRELEEKTSQTIDINSDKLKLVLDKKQNDLKIIQERYVTIHNRHKNNNTKLEYIKKSQKEFEKLSKQVEILDNLNRTANGSLNGKQKISFENYVLGTYFDEIIVAANQRFKDMTSYQFELRRAETKSGNAQTGLDLDVFDSYTGKTRSVSSLSGGESFKAALALSLGLSDIVQQQTGGIQIETMFIDEGFGSLDNESLEQTMKILQELSCNQTLIGIISHVDILREQIEKKIIVTKTQTGSKLEVNIG